MFHPKSDGILNKTANHNRIKILRATFFKFNFISLQRIEVSYLHLFIQEINQRRFFMRKILLASLFLIPQTYAACTYDLAPIRAFFNNIDGNPSYEGSLHEKERLSTGGIEERNMTGVWTIYETSPDHWQFLGDFCTSTICESRVIEYRIEDGCLMTGSNVYTVRNATAQHLDLSYINSGRKIKRSLTHSTGPDRLKINERIYEGKRWVFTSDFNGTR